MRKITRPRLHFDTLGAIPEALRSASVIPPIMGLTSNSVDQILLPIFPYSVDAFFPKGGGLHRQPASGRRFSRNGELNASTQNPQQNQVDRHLAGQPGGRIADEPVRAKNRVMPQCVEETILKASCISRPCLLPNRRRSETMHGRGRVEHWQGAIEIMTLMTRLGDRCRPRRCHSDERSCPRKRDLELDMMNVNVSVSDLYVDILTAGRVVPVD